MSEDCGKKKIVHGSGIYQMDVTDLRKLVKEIYNEEKLALPAISNSNRSHLCNLLKKTIKGQYLIETSVSQVKNNLIV